MKESKLGFALAFAVGMAVAGVIALAAGWRWLSAGGPTIDLSRPTIVRQVQDLQRLETVVFRMDKIVSGGFESRFLPRFLAGDRLLLIVYGEVTAGVDLGDIDAEHVLVKDGVVQLELPPAEIFSARIDNEKTRVYSRETGLFSSVDPNLETDVRREAEQQVRQGALDAGILQSANNNARSTLTAFLKGLGFAQVEVK